jgi:hypothetical protein
MCRKQAKTVLRPKDRGELERNVAGGNIPPKIAKRARIMLMTADGCGINHRLCCLLEQRVAIFHNLSLH